MAQSLQNNQLSCRPLSKVNVATIVRQKIPDGWLEPSAYDSDYMTLSPELTFSLGGRVKLQEAMSPKYVAVGFVEAKLTAYATTDGVQSVREVNGIATHGRGKSPALVSLDEVSGDFHSLTAHEVGHVLGLSHPSTSFNSHDRRLMKRGAGEYNGSVEDSKRFFNTDFENFLMKSDFYEISN